MLSACAGVVVAGDHHRLVHPDLADRGGPLGDRGLARARGVVEGVDPSRPCRPVQVAVGDAVVECRERPAFAGVALTHHLGQPQRTELAADGAQPTAGLDRGELARVADRDHLRPRLLGRLEQPRGRAGRCHAGLVEHDHAPLGERVAELVDVDQQPVKRPRRDPGLVGQLARRTTGRRDTEHLVAGVFVELA